MRTCGLLSSSVRRGAERIEACQSQMTHGDDSERRALGGHSRNGRMWLAGGAFALMLLTACGGGGAGAPPTPLESAAMSFAQAMNSPANRQAFVAEVDALLDTTDLDNLNSSVPQAMLVGKTGFEHYLLANDIPAWVETVANKMAASTQFGAVFAEVAAWMAALPPDRKEWFPMWNSIPAPPTPCAVAKCKAAHARMASYVEALPLPQAGLPAYWSEIVFALADQMSGGPWPSYEQVCAANLITIVGECAGLSHTLADVHDESGACYQQSQSQVISVTSLEVIGTIDPWQSGPTFGSSSSVSQMCAELNALLVPYGVQATCTGGAPVWIFYPCSPGCTKQTWVKEFIELTIGLSFSQPYNVTGEWWKDVFWEDFIEDIGQSLMPTIPSGVFFDVTVHGPQFGTITVPLSW